jgi:FtsP/CotA-like multicopper oxidase with cupredoxin domain
MISRRHLLKTSVAALAAGPALLQHAALAAETASAGPDSSTGPRRAPLTVPNGTLLPWRLVDGVKVYHLVAEEIDHEFAPGLRAKCWGFNGRTPGPVIEAVEGDRVRIYVTNKLPEPTSAHWHGIFVPNGMDGVGGLTQKAIPTGATFKYEFTLRQHGTFMYHPHVDEMTQMGLGMTGMFVVHPREVAGPPVDRDFSLMLHEWRIDPGAARPDPTEMTDFNVLTLNSKVFPATAPLIAKRGDRVRIRLGNLGAMDHHPIHLHGHAFKVVATDGGATPESAQRPETTVLVPVGSTRVVEFVADAPGDWAMHCHMTHHTMTQMGHGMPNLIGVDTGKFDPKLQKYLPGYMSMGQTGMSDMAEMDSAMGMPVPRNSAPMVGGAGPHGYIDMGGMFTILKVRENLANYDADPGWYQAPPGTVAGPATAEELRADLGDA